MRCINGLGLVIDYDQNQNIKSVGYDSICVCIPAIHREKRDLLIHLRSPRCPVLRLVGFTADIEVQGVDVGTDAQ